jgi:hypothetical protein
MFPFEMDAFGRIDHSYLYRTELGNRQEITTTKTVGIMKNKWRESGFTWFADISKKPAVFFYRIGNSSIKYT